VSNFPLNANVPASRPTLPIINSTAPENVTEFPSPELHFASEDLAFPQTFDCGSAGIKVPFPSPCASKCTERCSSFANAISMFHLPIRLGDCARLTLLIRTRINAEDMTKHKRHPVARLRRGRRKTTEAPSPIDEEARLEPSIVRLDVILSRFTSFLSHDGLGCGVGRVLGVG